MEEAHLTALLRNRVQKIGISNKSKLQMNYLLWTFVTVQWRQGGLKSRTFTHL